MSKNADTSGDLVFAKFVDFVVDGTAQRMPEVDSQSTRLVVALTRLANLLVYDIESTVHRPQGWSWPGFRVLLMLWLAGPCDATRVAALAGTSRAAVSALVKTLERDGLIERRKSAADRRTVQLALTDAGIDAISATYAAHNAREQSWTSALTAQEMSTLTGLIEKMGSRASHADIQIRD